jgi:hypothetical protein
VGAEYGSDAVRYEEVFERGVIFCWRGGSGLFEVVRFPQGFWVGLYGDWMVESGSCVAILGLRFSSVLRFIFLGAFRKGGSVPLDSTRFSLT